MQENPVHQVGLQTHLTLTGRPRAQPWKDPRGRSSLVSGEPADELRAGVHANLVEDAGEVPLRRRWRDAERRGDHRVGVAAQDQFSNLRLSRRQAIPAGKRLAFESSSRTLTAMRGLPPSIPMGNAWTYRRLAASLCQQGHGRRDPGAAGSKSPERSRWYRSMTTRSAWYSFRRRARSLTAAGFW